MTYEGVPKGRRVLLNKVIVKINFYSFPIQVEQYLVRHI